MECSSLWRSVRLYQDNESNWILLFSIGKHAKSVWYSGYSPRRQHKYFKIITAKDRIEQLCHISKTKKKCKGNILFAFFNSVVLTIIPKNIYNFTTCIFYDTTLISMCSGLQVAI
ncbi:hypothetical protein BDC45DRAFT_532180 [Circinella umbellata]|nr:hypothetical protein BDC45DRAFT_532180 [Circinella umbellata]